MSLTLILLKAFLAISFFKESARASFVMFASGIY